jgi:uncharacterized membrane protein
MDNFIASLSPLDWTAICFFFASWLLFDFINDHTSVRRHSLSGKMSASRKQWMLNMARNEHRMVDVQINASLQRGATFFASASILAIGGCFALLGSTDEVLQIYRDLPLTREVNRTLWEIKALLLSFIFTYTFFKFGWSYRLFSYCAILIGSTPLPGAENPQKLTEQARESALQTADMNIIAGRHFTAGLRGIFFALGFMGWFIGPKMLIGATLFILLVLVRRQYFSHARATMS